MKVQFGASSEAAFSLNRGIIVFDWPKYFYSNFGVKMLDVRVPDRVGLYPI